MTRPAPYRPPRTRPALAAAHRAEQLLRATVALVALAGLLAGLPWALAHYIGWPLPRDLPDWAEIQARLAGPISDTLLLDVLACILWPLWLAFLVAVARAIPDTLREARWPTGTPRRAGALHSLAGVLVGAVILTVAGNRGATGPATTAAAHLVPTGPATTLATLTLASPARHPDPRRDLIPGPGPGATATATARPDAYPQAPPGTAVVEGPHDGIYDSLWRIAERRMGDGARWPEIWALNEGVPQADGRALDNPQLLRPGWVLRLPTTEAAPLPTPATPPTPTPATPGTSPATPVLARSNWTPPSPDVSPRTAPARPTPPAPPPAPTPAGAPPAPDPPVTQRPGHPLPPAVDLPSGALLGLGTAALLCTALFSLRLWRRRHYQPGSGNRADLAEAPVVRALHTAYAAATAPADGDSGDGGSGDPAGRPRGSGAGLDAAGRRHAQATAADTAGPPGQQVVGVRDGRPLALDLAGIRGLGLVGPGTAAATRALLVALLAERHRAGGTQVDILIPAADARILLGEAAATRPPQRLHVTADIDTALDEAEAVIITRARLLAAGFAARHALPLLVVVATPAPGRERRLQAVLDNGSSLGVLGVLYGQWRAGATARVRADGTVSAASPNLAGPLVGSRLFTLPAEDAGALVDLLHAADTPAIEPHQAGRRPNPSQEAAPPPAPRATGEAPTPTGWLPDAGTTRATTGMNHPGDTGRERNRRPPPGQHLAPAPPAALTPAPPATPGPEPPGPAAVPRAAARPPDPTSGRPTSPAAPHLATVHPTTGPATGPATAPRDAYQHPAPPAPLASAPHAVPTRPAPPTPNPMVIQRDAQRERVPAPQPADTRDDREHPAPPAPALALAAGTAALRQASGGVETPFLLTVLGPLRLLYRPGGQGRFEPVDGVTPKAREVLAYLALHPGGARREAITAAIWPTVGDDRRLANRLYAALSQMRTALRTATGGAVGDITDTHGGRYALRRELVTSDLWQVRDALARHRKAASNHERLATLFRVAQLYTGDLADDLSGDWATAPREVLRRDVLDAFGSLAHTLGEDHLEQKLDLLEQQRNLDPYNEAVYRDIARTQARLDRHDAIPRTLALLTTTLTDIDEHPSPDTTAFFTALLQPRPTHPADFRNTRPA